MPTLTQPFFLRTLSGTDSANTPLLNVSWGAKPGYVHWNDLLFNQWWSRERNVTNDDGKVTFSVFKGAHTVSVTDPTTGGVASTSSVWVGANTTRITIKI